MRSYIYTLFKCRKFLKTTLLYKLQGEKNDRSSTFKFTLFIFYFECYVLCRICNFNLVRF